MSALAWIKARVVKSHRRSSFSNRNRRDGREEYVIRVAGFSGELRKYMTPKEAAEYVKSTNSKAFESAADASKGGRLGREEFSKHGVFNLAGMNTRVAHMAAKAFGVKKPGKERRHDVR